VHDVGGVFGLDVAIHGSFGIHDKSGAGAFFAMLAEVEAVAGLHPHLVLLAAKQQLFQALFFEFRFEGFNDILAHLILLGGTYKETGDGSSRFHRNKQKQRSRTT
jgi:hypothetical protein